MVEKNQGVNNHSFFEEFDYDAQQKAMDKLTGEQPIRATISIVHAMRDVIHSSELDDEKKDEIETLYKYYLVHHSLLEAI